MLAQKRLRSQMYFGVAMLLVIVAVLSISGFIGGWKFRCLTRSIKARATELPLAAKLSQQVTQLQTTLSRAMNPASGGQSFRIGMMVEEPPITFDQIALSVQYLQNALDNYRAKLETTGPSDPFISDKTKETKFVEKFDDSLAKIKFQMISKRENWVLDKATFLRNMSLQMSELQLWTSELPVYLQERTHAFADYARSEYRAWLFTSSVFGITALLMIAGLSYRFHRAVFKPLEKLVQGSRVVASGNFDYRIDIGTNDEVAELAHALNDMTRNFQSIKTDLNQKVAQRTKEVVRSEKMASVGFLAAGVAHEINNPLATIAWSAESLEARIHDILNPSEELNQQQHDAEIADMKKYLQRIQDEAFRCKEITSGLLDFSRMGDVKKVPTNLFEVVESVIEMVRPLSKYRGKNIEFNGDRTIYATANAQEMKQVALNLITNALGSVSDGGCVKIALEAKGKNALLRVTDNGCGMDEEVIQHLFEPFFTRRRDGQGTGLGLAITYQIIEDHEGQIIPSSDGPGQGSSFEVSLPLVKHEIEFKRAA